MSRLKFTKEMEAANLEWAKRVGLKTFDNNGNGSDGEDDQEDIRADGDRTWIWARTLMTFCTSMLRVRGCHDA